MLGFFKKKHEAKAAAPQGGRDEAVLSTISPLVKLIEFEDRARPTVEVPADEAPLSRPFVADLMIMYAEDKPTHFEFISARRLRELGMSVEELHSRALQNLPSRPPKIEVHGDPPRQMLVAGGNLEATLLLHDRLWDQLEAGVPGELLVVAPARDLVFVSNTSWEGARQFLSDLATRELEDKSHVLSRAILRRAQGKWIADAHAS